MNLTISGHHLEITPAIRSHVESKLDRMKRNFDGVIDISVLLAVDNVSDKERSQRAEIKLNLSGKTLHAESTAQDLYAAIDLLMINSTVSLSRQKPNPRNTPVNL